MYLQAVLNLKYVFRFMTSTPASSDANTFKKRIADSVAARLSPPRQRSDGTEFKINTKGVRNEANNEIWGLKRTNPMSLNIGGNNQSQPRSFISSTFVFDG